MQTYLENMPIHSSCVSEARAPSSGWYVDVSASEAEVTVRQGEGAMGMPLGHKSNISRLESWAPYFGAQSRALLTFETALGVLPVTNGLWYGQAVSWSGRHEWFLHFFPILPPPRKLCRKWADMVDQGKQLGPKMTSLRSLKLYLVFLSVGLWGAPLTPCAYTSFISSLIPLHLCLMFRYPGFPPNMGTFGI